MIEGEDKKKEYAWEWENVGRAKIRNLWEYECGALDWCKLRIWVKKDIFLVCNKILVLILFFQSVRLTPELKVDPPPERTVRFLY